MKRLISLLLPLCLIAGRAWADIVVPPLSGPVVDQASLLSAQEKSALEQLLLKVHESGKAQMAIFITDSLQDHDIESFSMTVAEKWKLGRKGQDQGLLMVVAPNERRLRIEVGYGLEGEITDAFSKHVLDDLVVPYFRQKRFGDGLMVAIEALSQKLGIDIQAPVDHRIHSKQGFDPGVVFLLLFIFFIVLIFRSGFFYPGGWGGGGGWGSGGGGSDFGGFSGGGGDFGGGGSSSSW